MCYARAADRIKEYAKTLTSDHNVTGRRWFYIDVDPERPAGVCSTNEQYEQAHATAERIWTYLREEHAWPEPMRTDSGNGAGLLYPIDLPNDDEVKAAVEGAIAALSARFGTKRTKIDRSVFNAARITRLPGTMNGKGDSTADQPHRKCRILAQPEPVVLLTLDQLKEVAVLEQPEPAYAAEQATPHTSERRSAFASRATNGQFDVATWLQDHGIVVKTEKLWHGSTLFVLEKCPFNPSEHNRAEAHVQRCPDGKLLFKCKHDSCQRYRWSDLRELFEPGYKNRRTATSNGQQQKAKSQAPPSPFEFKFRPYTSADFFAIERKHKWLVKRLLVTGEPVVIGGPRKCLKTSLLVDLAVSLASGTSFLGFFDIYLPVKVAILSGESGETTIEQTARRICAARDLDPRSLSAPWQFTLRVWRQAPRT